MLGAYGLVLGAGAGAALAATWFPGQVVAASLMQAGAGLLGLGAVLAFYRIGIFLIGAVASVLLAQAVAPWVGGITWEVQLMLALIAGSASVVVTRLVLIVATAITGAALVVRSAEVVAESPVRWLTDSATAPWAGVLPDAAFDLILHDPPTIQLAGDLYAEPFYRELRRVLARRGRLFHYVGSPESRQGAILTRGVIRRLRDAGFGQVKAAPGAYGVVAVR